MGAFVVMLFLQGTKFLKWITSNKTRIASDLKQDKHIRYLRSSCHFRGYNNIVHRFRAHI